MVMERIAAGPIDQLDVGISVPASIEFVALARRKQHVGDAGDRNHGARRIDRQRNFRTRDIDTRHADAIGRTVAKSKAGPGQANAAQHRCEHDRRPTGLLAMMRPLQ